MPTSNLFYVGGLLVLALLSGWLLATMQAALRNETPPDAGAPLLRVDRFEATYMNVQGVRQYTLTAPRLIHLPGEQGTRLEQPLLELFQEDGATRDWSIRAEWAWVSADQQLVRLEQAVSLTRTEASGQTPVVITGRNVSVRPDEGYAESAEAVQAKTPDGVLSATGFKARLREQQVELLSHVRGTYVPPER